MTFDELYQLVQANENVSELNEQLQGVFLDVLDDKWPFLTVAGKLASEKSIEKAEKLRELGASPQFIATGYALSGNHKKVREYCVLYPACVQYAAIGYALAANDEKVEEFRIKYQAKVDIIVEAYAMAGNDEKVEYYLKEHYAALGAILRGYALANNQDKIKEYLNANYPSGAIPTPILEAILQGYIFSNNHKMVEIYRLYDHSVNIIAHCYATIGNNEKVKEYYENYRADPTAIAAGYARLNNHQQVDYYHGLGANAGKIAAIYALNGNHEKAESYGLKDNSYNTKHLITTNYALGGFHAKVEHYRKKYNVSATAIAQAYATVNNHQKVEEYRKLHNADVQLIATAYEKSANPPPFYKAIKALEAHPEGFAIIAIMIRLKRGEDSKWNPYWMNSKTKLDGIVNVINKQELGFDLGAMLYDKKSELNIAINRPRISKLTIFGTPHWNESKSLSAVKSMPSLHG